MKLEKYAKFYKFEGKFTLNLSLFSKIGLFKI